MEALEVWNQLLTTVLQEEKIPRELELTLFHSSTGVSYTGELMVVGRAVNGWIPKFRRTDLNTNEARLAVVQREITRLQAEPCSMAWVESHWHNRDGYNTAQSAFWRVIRGVASGLDVVGQGWASQLAWSNLYRISPHKTGNPSSALAWTQLPMCRALLKADIDHARPKRLLFLTGLNWLQPFSEALGLELHPVGVDGVDAAGVLGETRVVVARHPQGKREQPMVLRILQQFAGTGSSA